MMELEHESDILIPELSQLLLGESKNVKSPIKNLSRGRPV
jgi:hypothetical protein